jgi:choline dehydrogenase-like flavoprotein
MSDFDAIVVGSGMSGGWSAKELTERGLKVLVLERGKDIVPEKDYSDMQAPWERKHFDKVPEDELKRDYAVQGDVYAMFNSNKHLWVKDSEHPYETPENRPYKWRRGYHLGGRSIMWARMSYRLSEYDFEANLKDGHGVDWPIRYADLAPWYDKVETFAGISGSREGLAQLPDGNFLPPFELTVAEQHLMRSIADNYDTRKLIIGRAANLKRATQEQLDLGRNPCMSRNLCYHGCSLGAYFSSNSATLPAAKRTNNLTIVTDAIVHSVEYDAKTNRVTGVNVIDAKTKEKKTYTGKMVFLNASTIASAMILLNSKSERFPNGLANSSDQVGRNLMDHVSTTQIQGMVPGYEDKYIEGRRPTVAYIPRYGNITEQDKPYKRGFAFQVYSGRDGWYGERPGLGEEFKKANRAPGPWRITLHMMGEVLPYEDNRVTPHKSKVDQWGLPLAYIDASMRENERLLVQHATRDAIEMMEQAGVVIDKDKRIDPMKAEPTDPGNIIHEMGTARMGRDPKTSVLNAWNQAHDVPNLFVTDGACMTSSAVVNPSLTYMAIAARAANHAADLLKEGKL